MWSLQSFNFPPPFAGATGEGGERDNGDEGGLNFVLLAVVVGVSLVLNLFMVKWRKDVEMREMDDIDDYAGGKGGGTRRRERERWFLGGGWFGARWSEEEKAGVEREGNDDEDDDEMLNRIEEKLRRRKCDKG